jgi:hypothetical protein
LNTNIKNANFFLVLDISDTDKAFKVEAKQVKTTLGDINLDIEGNEFDKLINLITFTFKNTIKLEMQNILDKNLIKILSQVNDKVDSLVVSINL